MGQRMYLAVVWPAEKDYMLPTMRQLMAAWGTAYGSKVRVWSEADEGLVAVRAEIDLISVERLVYLLRTMRPTLNSLLGDEWAVGWAAGEEGADMRIRDLGPVIGRIIPADYEMYKEAILSAPGLVGCWFFDEGRGDKVLDASGYGNHGTIYGAKWVKLDGVWALSFDGADDYVQVNYIDVFNTSDFTIECWVNPAIGGVNTNFIVAERDANAQDRSVNIDIFYDKFRMSFYADDLVGTTTIPVGKWTHLVATYTRSTNLQRIYVNGVIDGSRTATGDPVVTSGALTNGLRIGASAGSIYFNGLIAEVRIYARALSRDEIARHHQLGRQFYPA